jgi:hypothetical protein
MKLGATAVPKSACMICGEHVRFRRPAAAGADVVCGSPDCRVIMSRRLQVGPYEFRFLIERRRWQRRERERLAERSAREALENESIRGEVSRQERLPASEYPLVVLPVTSHRLEALTPDRRERYREHLAGIIAEAFAGGDDDAAPTRATSIPEDSPPLADRLCALCRGGCCTAGQDRAYLNAATIRRLMRQRPELSPEQISAEYLVRISEPTVAGSCINHTPAGCALPRELRSDACNAFYCEELHKWHTRFASGEAPRGAFVIQRGRDNWSQERSDAACNVVGVSIVTEGGTRSLER